MELLPRWHFQLPGNPRRFDARILLAAIVFWLCGWAGCTSSPTTGGGPAGSPTADVKPPDLGAREVMGTDPVGFECVSFTVAPPSGVGWREVERVTNRVVYAITGLKAKTFELSVSAWEEPWPIDSPDDFVRFVDARHTKRYHGSTSIYRSRFLAETNHAPLEVRWDLESRPLAGEWIVRSVGLEIRHPSRPDYFVRAMYRQVARTPDLDEQRSREAEAFFQGLKLR